MVKIFHERYRLNGNSSARIYAAPGLVKLFGNVFAENENKDTGGEVGRQTNAADKDQADKWTEK